MPEDCCEANVECYDEYQKLPLTVPFLQRTT